MFTVWLKWQSLKVQFVFLVFIGSIYREESLSYNFNRSICTDKIIPSSLIVLLNRKHQKFHDELNNLYFELSIQYNV